MMRLWTVLLLACLAGCSHTYERDWVASDYDAGRAGLVAVLPLENHTAYPNAGETVSELLATELRVRGFDVLDGHEVRRLLGLSPDDEGRALSKADLGGLAATLGANSVVAGSIGEFRYKRDLGEDPVVGFSVRLYDRAKARVVWAASHSRSEYGLLYHRDYLHENAQRIVAAMVDELMERAAASDPLPARAPSQPAAQPEGPGSQEPPPAEPEEVEPLGAEQSPGAAPSETGEGAGQ